MGFHPDPVHLTSAVTDLLLAFAAFGLVLRLRRTALGLGMRGRVWLGAFTCVGIAATFGAFRHGFALSPETDQAVRHFVNLFIALGVALFGAGTAFDLFGERVAKRVTPALLVAATAIGVSLATMPGTFILLTVFGAVILITALGTYLGFWLRRSLPGAGSMFAGVAVTVIGTAIQAGETLRVTVIWPLNHDDVFHLMQIGALALLSHGLVQKKPNEKDQGLLGHASPNPD